MSSLCWFEVKEESSSDAQGCAHEDVGSPASSIVQCGQGELLPSHPASADPCSEFEHPLMQATVRRQPFYKILRSPFVVLFTQYTEANPREFTTTIHHGSVRRQDVSGEAGR